MDNFNLIRPLFYFNEGNQMFFHCQLIVGDHEVVKTYFIRSKTHLDQLKEEIILLCNHYGAVAYINVSGKDFDAIQKLLLVEVANDINLNNVQDPMECLNSVASECKSRRPVWVLPAKEKILEWLGEYKIIAKIPTPQGCHILTTPFDLEQFHDVFPDTEVHENSIGTLLYCPEK